MSVIKPVPIESVAEERTLPSLTYRIDFDNGRIAGKVDGIEAVNQAIRKAIITPRFRCLIYDSQYGSELKNLITTQDVSPEYVECEIPRIIRDTLLVDDRILDVSDFKFSFVDDAVYIQFTADTVYGKLNIAEVV